MRKTIQKLQKKPAHVRERIAFGAAGTISGAIFIMWGVAFMAADPFAYEPVPTQSQAANPFVELSRSFQAGLAGVTASLEETQQEIDSRQEGEARLEIVNTITPPEQQEPQRTEVLTF